MNNNNFEFVADIAKESKERLAGKNNFGRSIFDRYIDAEPIYSKEDLEREKQISYQEGYKKAYMEIDQENEKYKEKLQITLDEIKHNLQLIDQIKIDIQEKTLEDMAKISISCAKKIAQDLIDENKELIIKNLVKKSLKLLANEPVLKIIISLNNFQRIKLDIEDIAKEIKFSGEISVLSDESIEDTDCKIIWHDGMVIDNKETIWKSIENILNKKTD